jgi:hypothetical protein
LGEFFFLGEFLGVALLFALLRAHGSSRDVTSYPRRARS